MTPFIDRRNAGRQLGQRLFEHRAGKAARENEGLERREHSYRGGGERLALQGRICLIIDDGIATGAPMQAAVIAGRKQNPCRIVVAAPVAAAGVQENFKHRAAQVVNVYTPADFVSVGLWYRDFGQILDEEVQALLNTSRSAGNWFIPEGNSPPTAHG